MISSLSTIDVLYLGFSRNGPWLLADGRADFMRRFGLWRAEWDGNICTTQYYRIRRLPRQDSFVISWHRVKVSYFKKDLTCHQFKNLFKTKSMNLEVAFCVEYSKDADTKEHESSLI